MATLTAERVNRLHLRFEAAFEAGDVLHIWKGRTYHLRADAGHLTVCGRPWVGIWVERQEGVRLCRPCWNLPAYDGPPPEHGHAGYTNYGCRCDICTTANTEKVREYRHRVGLHRPLAEYRASLPKRQHGRRSTYVRGCRCDACREAATAAQREYRARKVS